MRALLTPRWVLAALLVLIVTAVFINLGLWQLRRHDQRQLENTVGESRFIADPVPLGDLLQGAGDDYESLQYRKTTVLGRFDSESEVLIRSQVYLDNAGFHVITPLIDDSGGAVLVNRGWVPLVLDQVPVEEALPSAETVEVRGWIELTRTRGAFGPEDPAEGRLETMARVDIDRIEQQVPYQLAPVYLVLLGDQGEDLPVPLEPPTFADDGPHLAYAIQWFGFTAVLLVGFGFLARRALQRSA